MDLVYAQHAPSPHAGMLGPIQEVEDDYQLTRGVPRLEDWPSDAHLELDEDFGIGLDDVMKCLGSLVVVSDRLRAVLEAEALENTEMLPVTLIDLKGREIEDPYFVFHQTQLQDALDLEGSGAKANIINPDLIMSVEQLVLRETDLEDGVRVFRLARYPRPVLFEQSLAKRITAEGFTGIGFSPVEDFDRFTLL